MVKVEFPPFIAEHVKVWLCQIELILKMGNVGSEINKFNHLAPGLVSDVAARVQDILFNVPTDQPFFVLKQRIIDKYE